MREHAYYTCKLVLLVVLFMGFCNFMNARSQTTARLISFTRLNTSLSSAEQDDQARAISSILSEARKNFDVDFIYESKVLPSVKLVMDVEKFKNVEEFLDELLKPYNLRYKKVLNRAYVIYTSNTELKRLLAIISRPDGNLPPELLHAPGTNEPPPIVVTGRILDEKGAALEGVSITVKGANKGTLTDKEGKFRLEVSDPKTVLIFSLIGYQSKEVQVGDQTNIQLALAFQSQSLNDVVVVGYGTQKKALVTGAISRVKSSDMENQPVVRVDEALEGRTSGVAVAINNGSPGAAASVNIRGVTSINGSTPLYVVDGTIIDQGGIDYLNPADIESIDVLKDAASAAIYGTRGGPGVILITTKKGKSGATRVNYSGYVGTQAPSRKLDLLNATQYATLRNEASLAAGNGVIFQDPKSLGKGTDWQSTLFNNSAFTQNHSVNISGGNDKSTYLTSFGYFGQQGIVATSISDYKRFTVRINSEMKIKPWARFGENLGYSYIRSMGGLNTNSAFGGPLSSAINLDPTTPVVETDPAVLAQNPYSTQPVIKDPLGRPYAISNYVGQEITNPLAFIQTKQGNFGWSHNLVGNTYLELEPITGLKLRSSISIKKAFYGNESFTPLFYLNSSTSNLTNTSFYRENDQNLIWNWDNTITYTRDLGDHHFMILAGTSAERHNGSGVNGTYSGLPVSNFHDASMNYNIAAANRVAGGSEDQTYSVSSLIGRLTYNYAEKYLLTANFRRDGTSRFGPDKHYGLFPSFSVGWVPTKETFLMNSSSSIWLNDLKIRAGYGINGNDNLPDFKFQSLVTGGRNYVFGPDGSIVIGYSPDAPANPSLHWEQNSQVDVGFDAVVFKSFTASFDWFDKKTTGMLLQEQIPGYAGANSQPYGNIASLVNKGAELELGYNNKIGNVNLSVKANAAYIKNRITDIGAYNTFLAAGTFQAASTAGGEVSRIQVGLPLDAFYGYKTEGIFQTQADVNNYIGKNGPIQPNAKPGDFKFADLDGDGKITSADREYTGNPIPNWTFGFNITASWHEFDVMVFGQGVAGNKIFQGYHRLDIQNANYLTTALGRWTGPGTSNAFPRLVDGDPNGNFSNPSDFYLHDGSYLKVRTLELGYSLPRTLMNRIGFQRVRVYVSGNNLLTFTKYNGFDPEVGGVTGHGLQNHDVYGIDNGVYPQARSYMVGLNIGF